MLGLIGIMLHPVTWWRHKRRYKQWQKDTDHRWE